MKCSIHQLSLDASAASMKASHHCSEGWFKASDLVLFFLPLPFCVPLALFAIDFRCSSRHILTRAFIDFMVNIISFRLDMLNTIIDLNGV